MQKKTSILCSGVLCVSLLVGATGVYGNIVFPENLQKKDIAVTTATYGVKDWKDSKGNIDYPVTEDSKEWNDFKSHDEMVAACNVPEKLIKKMSTEELVDLMMDYPLLGDLRMYDDLNIGFQCLAKNSNVLSEILKREDGPKALLAAYTDLELVKENAKTEEIMNEVKDDVSVVVELAEDKEYADTVEEIADSVYEDTFLEVALSQEKVIDDLDSEELEVLSEEASEKVLDKAISDIYSSCTTIIYDNADSNDCLDKFDYVVDVEEVPNTENTVKGNANYTYVKTPKGSKVRVEIFSYYGLDAAIADYGYVRSKYPRAEIVSAATNQYNCHSYAWYKQSTSNTYWMNDPTKYMTDGSYKSINTPTKKGQKVCWKQFPLLNPNVHSGVVESVSGNTIKIKSKWGSCPLVIHNVNYSPYSGTPFYYKKK